MFLFFVSGPFRSFPFRSISARAHKLHTANTHRLFSCLFLHAGLRFLVSTPSSSAIKLTYDTTTRRNAHYGTCHSPSIVHQIAVDDCASLVQPKVQHFVCTSDLTCLPRALTHGRRAPLVSGTEWDGTERNGRQITGKKTETEKDVPFRRMAILRNGNVYFLMMPTVYIHMHIYVTERYTESACVTKWPTYLW